MLRPARKSGRKDVKRGLNKQQVCVVTGIDDMGVSFLVVSGRGMLGKERAYKVLNGRIGKGALVVTDKAGAYPAVLKRLGATLERTDATEHTINRHTSMGMCTYILRMSRYTPLRIWRPMTPRCSVGPLLNASVHWNHAR